MHSVKVAKATLLPLLDCMATTSGFPSLKIDCGTVSLYLVPGSPAVVMAGSMVTFKVGVDLFRTVTTCSASDGTDWEMNCTICGVAFDRMFWCDGVMV